MLRRSAPEVKIKPVALNRGGSFVKVDDERSVFVPSVIEGTVEDADWDVDFVVINVRDFDEPVIAELHIKMKHGDGMTPIAPDMVRGLKLGEVRRRAVTLASMPVRVSGEDSYELLAEAGSPTSTRAVFSKQRRAVTVDEIQRAADLYMGIRSDPHRRDTTLGVAKELHVSRATAARRIQKARELGLIKEDS